MLSIISGAIESDEKIKYWQVNLASGTATKPRFKDVLFNLN